MSLLPLQVLAWFLSITQHFCHMHVRRALNGAMRTHKKKRRGKKIAAENFNLQPVFYLDDVACSMDGVRRGPHSRPSLTTRFYTYGIPQTYLRCENGDILVS
ncbi:hypothetical protein BDV38DRAFT_252121 [Aspergillus pseudotamarii]|uniref:Secreted protein n=1 Tax=Aspergillus pseudotamarii TaxID=132259 RepID=A0A5N6SLH3_ASPPS|nr:uncharacterized protein BDV38DRAFT_252121 [Aspergillus pseudotamarii]KAE8135548.1 hypothetical protein BDV38DRAFT_252121 [Aspergillus pseudotamarii]